MTTIAHIIQPVEVAPPSDLVVAQPITVETMRIAREFVNTDATSSIWLASIQAHDEEPISVPPCFTPMPPLTRSITDIKTFRIKRKLPLIKDILDALYQATTPETDYMIYTNVDIALQPYFYQSVLGFIQQGYDAFTINRRTITGQYSTISQIPLMYAEIGESHKGYDCFVFKRDLYPQFKLGNICIGTAWIGRALLANMVTYATRFREFREEHLTFHIGDAMNWRNQDYADYFQENREEYLRLFQQLENDRGPFEPVWRSYLLDTGAKRQFPQFK